jgi:hypothetical protein
MLSDRTARPNGIERGIAHALLRHSLLRQQQSIKKIGKAQKQFSTPDQLVLSHFHDASIDPSDSWPPVVNGGPGSDCIQRGLRR